MSHEPLEVIHMSANALTTKVGPGMLRYGTTYIDRGAQFYEVQQRTRDIRRLKQRAAKLGFQLLQASAPAA